MDTANRIARYEMALRDIVEEVRNLADEGHSAETLRARLAKIGTLASQTLANLTAPPKIEAHLAEEDLNKVFDQNLDGLREQPPEPPPVDRSAVTLTDGSPVEEGHTELKPNGQQKGYVVLSTEERAKGFVRPVHLSYVHVGPPGGSPACGTVTTMALELGETYARDPTFYGSTFCAACGKHFPVGAGGEFVWEDGSRVGT